MPEVQVPEELLREILEYTLWPEPFSRWLEESAEVRDADVGGPTARRSTSVLTVCKRWLRIATPIFYRYLFLSTTEQVQAFADVLSSNPEIGRVVKYLRLEGGYGKALGTVLKNLPNVESLSLNVHVPSNGRTSGITRSLSLLKPKRLYLRDLRRRRRYHPANKPTKLIREAVYQCMKQWTQLEYLYIAESWHSIFREDDGLTGAVVDCTSLRTISVPSPAPISLKRLCGMPYLQTINYRAVDSQFQELQNRGPNEMPEKVKTLIVQTFTRSTANRNAFLKRMMEALEDDSDDQDTDDADLI